MTINNRWAVVLGDFTTGDVIMDITDYIETASVTLDVFNEDTTDIVIPIDALSEDGIPQDVLKAVSTYIAIIDTSKAWNAPYSVLYAGMLNRVEPDFGGRRLKLQVVGIAEYMKARLLIQGWDTITNAESKITFTGENLQQIIEKLIEFAFKEDPNLPSGLAIPQVLGDVTYVDLPKATTPFERSFLFADKRSVYGAIETIQEEANNGMEYRFTPVFTSSAMDKIKWNVTIGHPNGPHIGYENIRNLYVDSANANRITAFNVSVDSTTLTNKKWGQSKKGQGDDKTIDLTPKWVAASGYTNVLLESGEDFSVELTPLEMQIALQERVTLTSGTRQDIDLEVVQAWDDIQWMESIGSKVNMYSGDENSPAHTFLKTMRLTEASIDLTAGPRHFTVKMKLQEPQVYYTRLPSDRKGAIGKNLTKDTTKPASTTGQQGGSSVNPWLPGQPEDDGDGGPGASWGFGGGHPDQAPLSLDSRGVTATLSTTSALPITTGFGCQTEGNIFFLFVEGTISYHSAYYSDVETAPTGIPVITIGNSANNDTTPVYSGYLQGGIFIDAKLVKNEILYDSEISAQSNAILPFEINANYRIEEYQVIVNYGSAVSSCGYLIIPITHHIKRRRVKWNGTNLSWVYNEPLNEEGYTTFVAAQYIGHSALGEWGVIPNTYIDDEIAGSSTSATGSVTRVGAYSLFPRFQAENRTSIRAIDWRKSFLNGSNPPIEHWILPTAPIIMVNGKNYVPSVVGCAHGLYKLGAKIGSPPPVEETFVPHIFMVTRVIYMNQWGNYVTQYDIWAMPLKDEATSPIPNFEEYNWEHVVTDQEGVGMNLDNRSNCGTTWDGRAIFSKIVGSTAQLQISTGSTIKTLYSRSANIGYPRYLAYQDYVYDVSTATSFRMDYTS